MRSEDAKTLLKMELKEDGSIVVTDVEGVQLKPIDADTLFKGLSEGIRGAEIVNLPPITILKRNPSWVQILGDWYFM